MESKSSRGGGDAAPLALVWECEGEVAALKPEVGERYLEWQAGVLSADRPAVRAMCRSGDCGSWYMAWWVSRKRRER
jgi:hypothetical protein